MRSSGRPPPLVEPDLKMACVVGGHRTMPVRDREGAMAVEEAVKLRPRTFTIEEFEQLFESGILHENERVELIEGQIVEMNPIGDDHIGRVNRLTRIFARCADINMSIQNPVRLAPGLMPQPDMAILRLDASMDRKPVPEEVLLLIEVADSSLAYDRQVKANL